MATLIKRLFRTKKIEKKMNTAWAEPKEQKEFQRTLESWREAPLELMVQ